MTTKFNRVSRVSHERSFNLDSLEHSHWRNRINQLKRELRESPASTLAVSAPSFSNTHSNHTNSARPAPRRRPSR